jgi:hypothetical protein
MTYLCAIYAIILSMFYLNSGVLLAPLFEALNIQTGIRTPVASVALILIAAATLSGRNIRGASQQIFGALALWLPWILYLFLRCDFDDPYALKKFALIVSMQFTTVITLIVFCQTQREKFVKNFFYVTIVFATAFAVFMMLNPAIFLYDNRIARLTIEGMNPIWLARAFAIAAICLLTWKGRHKQLRLLAAVAFGVAILPTGSRGPLISLLAVSAAYWVFARSGLYAVIGRVGIVLFGGFILAAAAWPILKDPVNAYFQRDSSRSVYSESGRKFMFNQALQDISRSPVLGVGLGQFARDRSGTSVNILGGKNWKDAESLRRYPHNIVLEILSETGIVGLMLVLVALRPGRWLVTNQTFTYLFYLSALFSMTSGDLPANTSFFVFAGLAWATSQRQEAKSHSRGKSLYANLQ